MSLFVLDTDVLSLLQRGHPIVVQRCASKPASELAITVISVEEQLSGWYRVRPADSLCWWASPRHHPTTANASSSAVQGQST